MGLFGALVILAGCAVPKREDAGTDSAQLMVYEGLPHQFYEQRELEKEIKTKETVALHGYRFYSPPVEISDDEGRRLKALLEDDHSFKEWSGEKKCGGFHPDYAVQWRVGDSTHQYLICFGCGEAKVFGPNREARYDLAAEQQLKEALGKYRKNWPATGP